MSACSDGFRSKLGTDLECVLKIVAQSKCNLRVTYRVILK